MYSKCNVCSKICDEDNISSCPFCDYFNDKVHLMCDECFSKHLDTEYHRRCYIYSPSDIYNYLK